MYPVNQVFLGGDSMSGQIHDLDTQLQMMEAYKNKLQQLKDIQNQKPEKLIWDDIDSEVRQLSEEQRLKLFEDKDYYEVYTQLQTLVQSELLNLVKSKIEGSVEGKALLEKQLKIVKNLKDKIISDTNKEMELFKKFREFSKNNIGITYEEFIKNNM